MSYHNDWNTQKCDKMLERKHTSLCKQKCKQRDFLPMVRISSIDGEKLD